MLMLLLSLSARADEGMWLPEQVPALGGDLTARGLEIPPEKLSDPLAEPLDAIVSLGFCSGSFVSPDGLIATNRHCVESYLQYSSSAERPWNEDGFVAHSADAELWAGPTARIYIVEKQEDVTAAVRGAGAKKKKDADREEALERKKKELVAACEAQPNRRCRVASYHGGLEYRLITQRELKDVRVVYAPPDAVGNYGDDIDNWMWPRHSGDFAFIRAYVAPDGSSEEHDQANVPYRPAHSLRIQPKGVSAGDLVWAAGFPGHTDRHDLEMERRFAAEVSMPRRLELYDEVIALLQAHGEAHPEVAPKLMAPIASLTNGAKYSRGVLDNLARTDLLARKEALEAELQVWIEAEPARKKKHGAALAELKRLIAAEQASWERDTLAGWLMYSSDQLRAAHTAYRFAVEREKPDLERDAGYQERDRERIEAKMRALDETMVPGVEPAVLTAMLTHTQALPADQRVPPVDAWLAEAGGIDAGVATLAASTALQTADGRLALLAMSPEQLEASDDPWVRLAVAMEGWLAPERAKDDAYSGAMARLRPVYIEALLGLRPGRVYPDANSTLRLTFGTVEGYSPRDAVTYAPFTTVAGMAAKAGPAPFDVQQRYLDAAKVSPGSPWADPALGDVPVDFLSTVDSTGGNSGSPTLNGRGELVGLLFDGNIEAVASDWVFQPEINRAIHVDVRYMLWVLEVDGARRVLDELGVPASTAGE